MPFTLVHLGRLQASRKGGRRRKTACLSILFAIWHWEFHHHNSCPKKKTSPLCPGYLLGLCTLSMAIIAYGWRERGIFEHCSSTINTSTAGAASLGARARLVLRTFVRLGLSVRWEMNFQSGEVFYSQVFEWLMFWGQLVTISMYSRKPLHINPLTP